MTVRVYVMGPYSQGDRDANVQRALDVGTELLEAGHAPYVPHLSHFWELYRHHPYAMWLRLGIAYLEGCEAAVRIPGPSEGADREELRSRRLGIPIFGDVRSCLQALQEGPTHRTLPDRDGDLQGLWHLLMELPEKLRAKAFAHLNQLAQRLEDAESRDTSSRSAHGSTTEDEPRADQCL